MIGAETHSKFDMKPVKEATKKANYNNLGHAAASLRKDAISKIVLSAGPSTPGRPVHTRRGLAKRALLYFNDREAEEALVGFSASVLDDAMRVHELGGSYKGVDYPARPTLGPAMERGATRMAESWGGTIGE